jgi:hypothetical protein
MHDPHPNGFGASHPALIDVMDPSTPPVHTSLHRWLPFLFSPNVIASLQDERRSFTEVSSRMEARSG